MNIRIKFLAGLGAMALTFALAGCDEATSSTDGTAAANYYSDCVAASATPTATHTSWTYGSGEIRLVAAHAGGAAHVGGEPAAGGGAHEGAPAGGVREGAGAGGRVGAGGTYSGRTGYTNDGATHAGAPDGDIPSTAKVPSGTSYLKGSNGYSYPQYTSYGSNNWLYIYLILSSVNARHGEGYYHVCDGNPSPSPSA